MTRRGEGVITNVSLWFQEKPYVEAKVEGEGVAFCSIPGIDGLSSKSQ